MFAGEGFAEGCFADGRFTVGVSLLKDFLSVPAGIWYHKRLNNSIAKVIVGSLNWDPVVGSRSTLWRGREDLRQHRVVLLGGRVEVEVRRDERGKLCSPHLDFKTLGRVGG